MEKGVEAPMRDCTEKPTTRGSIKYDMSSNVTSQRMREEICDLMSMEEVNKPALRIQFLTRDGDANTNKGAVFLYFIFIFLFKFWPQNNVVFTSSKYKM